MVKSYRLPLLAALALGACKDDGVAPTRFSLTLTRADTVVTGFREQAGLSCTYVMQFESTGSGVGRWTRVMLTHRQPGKQDIVQLWEDTSGLSDVFGSAEIRAPYGMVRLFSLVGSGPRTTDMLFRYQDPAGKEQEIRHSGSCISPP